MLQEETFNGVVVRINRYIMECKCTTNTLLKSAGGGINRYIMECK